MATKKPKAPPLATLGVTMRVLAKAIETLPRYTDKQWADYKREAGPADREACRNIVRMLSAVSLNLCAMEAGWRAEVKLYVPGFVHRMKKYKGRYFSDLKQANGYCEQVRQATGIILAVEEKVRRS